MVEWKYCFYTKSLISLSMKYILELNSLILNVTSKKWLFQFNCWIEFSTFISYFSGDSCSGMIGLSFPESDPLFRKWKK